jgi:hypothetical protein
LSYIEELRARTWDTILQCHAKHQWVRIKEIRRVLKIKNTDRSRIVFITRFLKEFQQAGKIILLDKGKYILNERVDCWWLKAGRQGG